ncbi:hypothetical protein HII31_01289 [Pseudocercospora fuligena]|uniref:Uncharacterized protein n=1 Tax=Pseudocercospora fuligena TaxID=685502 RepID=A0A8H6RUI4_9PEZI|nr:hypothetical protein HII31_01289 [Pseudocercospora fuligena]
MSFAPYQWRHDQGYLPPPGTPSHCFTLCTKNSDPKPPPAPAPPASDYAPPTLRPGVNYLFAEKSAHTILHIFSKAAPIWEEKYHGQNLNFKMFKVATSFQVKTIIERILKKAGDDCKGWSVTEVVEGGCGVWRKGTTIKYEDDKGKGDLNGMGWNEKRGDKLPPVWLVVHKA